MFNIMVIDPYTTGSAYDFKLNKLNPLSYIIVMMLVITSFALSITNRGLSSTCMHYMVDLMSPPIGKYIWVRELKDG